MTPATTGKRRYFTPADLSEAERDRIAVAVHEAGHAVVGVVLGGVLHTSVVGSSKVTGLQGLTSFADLSAARDGEVSLAGPWAEAKWATGRRPTFADLDPHLSCTRHDSDAMMLTRSGGMAAALPVTALIERCWAPRSPWPRSCSDPARSPTAMSATHCTWPTAADRAASRSPTSGPGPRRGRSQ